LTGNRNNTSPSLNSSEKAFDAAEALKTWVAQNKGLLEIFLDAYCVVDVTNRVVDFNTAFMELCGETYRKILKIGNFCDLIKTERCPTQCPAKLITTSEKSLRIDEITGTSKAHPSIAMILGGVPLFDSEKRFIGSLITIRNVSAESELQKKYDQRKRDSITDGLTRLFNKVYAESVLQRMVKATSRDKTNLSLVMCDIDHFKQVNDVHGHPAGDHILKTVAEVLKGASRETDIIGRFGGEEFICILHNTDQKGALIFAERFRKKIEATKMQFAGKDIPVTVSLGTATMRMKWDAELTAQVAAKEIINQADTALYLAKANGRNQTWQFENVPKKKTGTNP
jgi:diguanylate cyclase (GGDEF)-like protein